MLLVQGPQFEKRAANDDISPLSAGLLSTRDWVSRCVPRTNVHTSSNQSGRKEVSASLSRQHPFLALVKRRNTQRFVVKLTAISRIFSVHGKEAHQTPKVRMALWKLSSSCPVSFYTARCHLKEHRAEGLQDRSWGGWWMMSSSALRGEYLVYISLLTRWASSNNSRLLGGVASFQLDAIGIHPFP